MPVITALRHSERPNHTQSAAFVREAQQRLNLSQVKLAANLEGSLQYSHCCGEGRQTLLLILLRHGYMLALNQIEHLRHRAMVETGQTLFVQSFSE